jgi:signal transduction histidine kinase
MEHYHMHSIIEPVDSMIKAKFGDSLRSKSDTGQINEALCKVLCQHSGCEGLEASLEIHPGRLVGTVRDDGDGFDADAATSDASGDDHRSGLGLRSMRERAEMVGGELNLTSHPGDGTTMEIRVPLED